ncbi:holo-ACP synthase [uncultured Bifidobacterium sp.]|uniref:holo-ACP synthase n=1 Tax=uncultured Bifidobacterium sp. TaxID=165187 RepID=UPI0028DD07B8|nr:holo-ACP synthase [uncultured Bifidobacterium sp.]
MEGLGHDVVDITDFARRLRVAGSRMPLLFSARERRQCSLLARRHGDGEARHLAARWAGKESVVKAWCEAVDDPPYSPDDLPWEAIEILDDPHGVPRVLLRDDLCAALSEGVRAAGDSRGGGARSESSGNGADLRWHVSLSHDGDVASAVAVLVMEPASTR